jgi:hypothetical protein
LLTREDHPNDSEDLPNDWEDHSNDSEDLPNDREDHPNDSEDLPNDREDHPNDSEDLQNDRMTQRITERLGRPTEELKVNGPKARFSVLSCTNRNMVGISLYFKQFFNFFQGLVLFAGFYPNHFYRKLS